MPKTVYQDRTACDNLDIAQDMFPSDGTGGPTDPAGR